MHEHTILPDGRVVLCCNDFGMKHVLGNIYNDSYEAVRSGREMRRIFRGQDNESINILCRKCHFAVNKNVLEASSAAPFSVSKKQLYVNLMKLSHLRNH
jgi:hypothetical protein